MIRRLRDTRFSLVPLELMIDSGVRYRRHRFFWVNGDVCTLDKYMVKRIRRIMRRLRRIHALSLLRCPIGRKSLE